MGHCLQKLRPHLSKFRKIRKHHLQNDLCHLCYFFFFLLIIFHIKILLLFYQNWLSHGVECNMTNIFQLSHIVQVIPIDTRRKLNVHKTFNLHPVSTGLHSYNHEIGPKIRPSGIILGPKYYPRLPNDWLSQ